jgi:hypothetical protein
MPRVKTFELALKDESFVVAADERENVLLS